MAHHSGLERADTLEALRKLDEQFGRIDRARRYAPRPYRIVVLSDHGQTQGATFKQRNGYGLDELVERSLRPRHRREGRRRRRAELDGRPGGRRGDGSSERAAGQAREERRLGSRRRRARLRQPRARLADGGEAPAHARGDRRAPSRADPGAPRAIRTSAGSSSARPSAARSPSARRARTTCARRTVEGDDPLASFSAERAAAPAAHGRLPARRRHHGRQLLRPGPRGGLRVRGADLVPRRARRAPDTAVHPPPRRPSGARRGRSSAPSRCTRCCRAGDSCCRAREQPEAVAAR